MSFTVFENCVPCPACQAETIDLYVLAETSRGNAGTAYGLADHGSQPCVECGYTLTAAEEAALAEAKLDAWEPPSAADLADAKGGW